MILFWGRAVDCYTGFDWDRVKFLHSGLYGAMFWTCTENSVDDTLTFQLLLSDAYIASRPFLLIGLPRQ